jgi:hypothetical protein
MGQDFMRPLTSRVRVWVLLFVLVVGLVNGAISARMVERRVGEEIMFRRSQKVTLLALIIRPQNTVRLVAALWMSLDPHPLECLQAYLHDFRNVRQIPPLESRIFAIERLRHGLIPLDEEPNQARARGSGNGDFLRHRRGSREEGIEGVVKHPEIVKDVGVVLEECFLDLPRDVTDVVHRQGEQVHLDIIAFRDSMPEPLPVQLLGGIRGEPDQLVDTLLDELGHTVCSCGEEGFLHEVV